MTEPSAYAVLALSAFLSATLLPGSSEAALVALLATGTGQPALLVAVAGAWATGVALLGFFVPTGPVVTASWTSDDRDASL